MEIYYYFASCPHKDSDIFLKDISWDPTEIATASHLQHTSVFITPLNQKHRETSTQLRSDLKSTNPSPTLDKRRSTKDEERKILKEAQNVQKEGKK